MSSRQRPGVHYGGIMLVVYGLCRLFGSKRRGKVTMDLLAATRPRGAGG